MAAAFGGRPSWADSGTLGALCDVIFSSELAGVRWRSATVVAGTVIVPLTRTRTDGRSTWWPRPNTLNWAALLLGCMQNRGFRTAIPGFRTPPLLPSILFATRIATI